MQPPEVSVVAEPGLPAPARLVDRVRTVLGTEALALLLAWLALVAVFAVTSPFFLSVGNSFNIGRAVAVTSIVACGTTIALISGAIDLSIAAVMDLAAVTTGTLNLAGVPAPLAMLAGVVVGTTVGVFNGFVVTRLRINPIIATLASAGIVRGIAYLVTSGHSEALSDPFFKFLGRSFVVGIPISMVLGVAVILITMFILQRTVFGRMVYAIGGNPVAAALAGINIDRWRMLFFMASSLSASLAGVLLLSKLGTVIPNAAAGTELNTIAAVILGGTSLAGGAGTVQGTVVGVLILGTLTNGLTLLNIDPYWQAIVAGFVLILAVGADRFRTGGYR